MIVETHPGCQAPTAALIDSEPEAYGTSHRRRRGLLTARRKVLHWAARRPGAPFCALMSSSPSAYSCQRFSRCCQEWRPSIALDQFSGPTLQLVCSNLRVPQSTCTTYNGDLPPQL